MIVVASHLLTWWAPRLCTAMAMSHCSDDTRSTKKNVCVRKLIESVVVTCARCRRKRKRCEVVAWERIEGSMLSISILRGHNYQSCLRSFRRGLTD